MASALLAAENCLVAEQPHSAQLGRAVALNNVWGWATWATLYQQNECRGRSAQLPLVHMTPATDHCCLPLPLPACLPGLPRPAPTTEAEVFLAIFDYIDRLFAIVRPRKLLYMAIGGWWPSVCMELAGLGAGRRCGQGHGHGHGHGQLLARPLCRESVRVAGWVGG